jgi:hypothetical protein
MSAALYIVLERPIKGFDHFVSGKALARAGEILDTLAQKSWHQTFDEILKRRPG